MIAAGLARQRPPGARRARAGGPFASGPALSKRASRRRSPHPGLRQALPYTNSLPCRGQLGQGASMAIAARLEPERAQERRSKQRRKLSLDSNIHTGEIVSVHDISPTGMLIETDADLSALDRLEIDLPENGTTNAIIAWNSGRYYGCEFSKPLSPAKVSAALLRSTPEATHGLPDAGSGGGRAVEQRASEDASTRSPAWEHTQEREWSLGASTRFILGSSILLW